MRVLITWGSKRRGTEGIARIIGEALRGDGVEVALRPAGAAGDVSGFDAVIVGGALYANRWHRAARRFVRRNEQELRRLPVWLFSSGPLDESADQRDIPPTAQVAALMERVGARGHTTFGGRLERDAKGLIASRMARTHSGDWRNPERIRAWAAELARALPYARPGDVVPQPARSWGRLAAHGVLGWALCGAVMGAGLRLASTGAAIALHAVAAPIIFAAIAVHYFRARGAREPLPTALAFVAIVAALDLAVVSGLVLRSLDMFASFAGFWLPIALIFAASWATGALVSMMPAPGAPPRHASPTSGRASA